MNIAPAPNDSFSLIVAPVEVLGEGTHPDYQEWIRGWIKPELPLNEFLEAYSMHGGTHHCALVLGDCRREITAFARAAGFETVVLESEGMTHG